MKRTGLHANELQVLSVPTPPPPNVRSQKGCRCNLVKSRLTQSPLARAFTFSSLSFPFVQEDTPGCAPLWPPGPLEFGPQRSKALDAFKPSLRFWTKWPYCCHIQSRLKGTRTGPQKMKTQALRGARDSETLRPGPREGPAWPHRAQVRAVGQAPAAVAQQGRALRCNACRALV